METENNRSLVSWIDLRAENKDIKLVANRYPSGIKRLVLVAPENSLTTLQQSALEEMGFYRGRSGVFCRDDMRFSLKEIRKVFPAARAVRMPMYFATRVMPVLPNGASQPEFVVKINAAVMNTRPVGTNYRGETVYEGEDVRFTNPGSGKSMPVPEEKDSGALFLRAKSADDLALCADGFVGEMAEGKIYRFDDLKRFASVITGVDESEIVQSPKMRDVQESIEAAMVRFMRAHAGYVVTKSTFNLAIRLNDGQPTFSARTSDSILLQQYSTPLPFGLAVQRILGDCSDKTIIEPTIGNGALVCALRGGKVFGCDLDDHRLDNVRRDHSNAIVKVADATSFDFKKLNDGNPFDLVVSNPPFGGLDRPIMMNGLKITRIDHQILMRALQARSDIGLGVFIIGADSYLDAKSGQVHGGSRYLFNWLADHYRIDVVEVDGGLYAKQGASFPVRIVVVGPKGEGHAQIPDQLPVLFEYDELFEWAAQMETKYAQALFDAAPKVETDYVPNSFVIPTIGESDGSVHGEEGKAPDSNESQAVVPGEATSGKISEAGELLNFSDHEENSYQSPYPAYSRVSEPTAMIPRNLSTPTRMALSSVVEESGGVDDFVALELGWSVDQMAGYLSPEQVDAVALAITSIRRGRGFLEADQTGLGKGRVMAALARYSALNSIPIIFLTETPTLFTDFWRDIRDIGSESLFNPLIVNDGVSVYDPIEGRQLIPATPKATIEQALKSGRVDAEYNLILGTYSQFNRERSKSAKARWISDIAQGRALLLDEAHNAAGDSNTGKNIGLAIEGAELVVYSSATSMKGSKNVMIYSKLFPNSVDMGALPDTLAAGGEVLQEVLSGMLAQDGVFVRREHDLSNLIFRTITDVEREERNRGLSDKLSVILEYMNYLSGDINQLVNERNKEIKDLLESIPDEERKGNRMGAISVNFGSRLFAIYRQFMMAIKTDLAAERAIQALEEGKKPVIVLENTMESLLNDVIQRNRPDILDMEDMADVSSISGVLKGEVTLDERMTFRDVLYRMLDRLKYYCETTRYGEVRKVPVISDEALETMSLIKSLIDEFPDLPISPLDEIHKRISDAGYSCDELSGRKMQLVERGEGYSATAILERPKPQIVKDFVTGGTDALLLTRAGSTGISLHASEKFPDQRQRVMIELQSAADVNVRVQFFGRVNRKGQTSSPEIETLSSGLIGEARPIAMQNAKLRKLSANTTANQDNAALDRSVPDFINSIGDEVAYRYLEANPSIARRLDIDMDNADLIVDEAYFINKLTSRLVMLRVSEQEQIYEALSKEYLRVIRELDAKGINPLKSRELDIKATETSMEVFEGGNPYSDSAFSLPVYVKNIEYQIKVDPIRSTAVRQHIQENAAAVVKYEINKEGRENQEFFLGLKGFLAGNRRKFLESVKGKDFASIEEALSARKINAVQKMMQRLRVLDSVLDGLYVGAIARFTNNDDEVALGFITAISVPENPKHIHLLGAYELAFAVPGKSRFIERTLYSLQDDKQFQLMPASQFESPLFAEFDTAPDGWIKHKRLILDGNLFKAAQIAAAGSMGNSVIYTDDQGFRRRGVLLARGVETKDLRELPVRIETPDMVVATMRHFEGLLLRTSTVTSTDQEEDTTIELSGDGLVHMCVPGVKSRGGRFFGNEDLIKWTGPFAGSRSIMTAKFPFDNLKPAMQVLYKMGVSLYVDSAYRDEINKLSIDIYSNESCDIKVNDSRMSVM